LARAPDIGVVVDILLQAGQEGLGIVPSRRLALADGADAGSADGVAHEVLVPSRRREPRRIGPRSQGFCEVVGEDDPGLGAGKDCDDGGPAVDLSCEILDFALKGQDRMWADVRAGGDQSRDGRLGVRVHDDKLLPVPRPDALREDRPGAVGVDDDHRPAVDGFPAHEFQVQQRRRNGTRRRFLEGPGFLAIFLELRPGLVDQLRRPGPREAVDGQRGKIAGFDLPLELAQRRQVP